MKLQIPQINITNYLGKIGMSQTPALLEIKQPPATLSIEQPKATMDIQTKHGKLTIDQTQAWDETNLMDSLKFSSKYLTESLHMVQEGVARRAEEGAQLINIHDGVNYFVEQAKQNGHRHPKPLSIKYIPSPLAVKYDYAPAEVSINIQANKPIIDVKVNKPEMIFHRGGVSVWMEQYPHLEIDFTV